MCAALPPRLAAFNWSCAETFSSSRRLGLVLVVRKHDCLPPLPPPPTPRETSDAYTTHCGPNGHNSDDVAHVEGTEFAFQTRAWRDLKMEKCILQTIIRQRGDSTFIKLLNEVRLGKLSHASLLALSKCDSSVKPKPNDGILPTKLYCINADVDKENERRLDALDGQGTTFDAFDDIKNTGSGSGSKYERDQLLEAASKKVPTRLKLKVGAQVVLLRNLDVTMGLANGSRGVVVAIEEMRGKLAPKIRFDCGVEQHIFQADFFVGRGALGALVRWQLPIKLAWAITVHKSQGMTLSRVEVEVGNAFDFGQVYVALSRCVSLAGLWTSGPKVTPEVIKAHADVIEFYRN